VIATLGGAGSGLVWGWFAGGIARPRRASSIGAVAAAFLALAAEAYALAGGVAAVALVGALGGELREIDIKTIAGDVFQAIGHDAVVEDVTFENVQAWTRKVLLFATASRERAPAPRAG